MAFSRRTNWNTDESALAKAYRERRASGLPIADLTASNPTRCGFEYPLDLLAPLADTAALNYDPDPRCSVAARESICGYYRAQKAEVSPEQIIVTTSTSEAYGFLLKLLCDPEDRILVPQPSYPLFDFLAGVEVVQVDFAPLVYDHGWQLDLEGLRRQITNRTRAVVLVHPNNPTGHFTKPAEAYRLASICREYGLALIVDEVFLDYGLTEVQEPAVGAEDEVGPARSFAALDLGVLTFIVSGISKICGLPQMKAAWLVATGPGSKDALERLEVVSDTYLSMNAPVQRALPVWLAGRKLIQRQILERVRDNLAALDHQLAMQPETWVSRLQLDGGWYAVLRIPALSSDEVTVKTLLDEGVWVHPGYFFGMGQSGWLVVSLLTPMPEFSFGIGKLLAYFK